MKLLNHPNIVRIHEVYISSSCRFLAVHIDFEFNISGIETVKNHLQVLGTKTKIYIAMEYASGGQLSDKMVRLT